MEGFPVLLFTACMLLVSGNRLNDRTQLSDFLDTCMDAQSHKSKPGPEDSLHAECTPWKNRACCHKKTTEELHQNATWYKFTWGHCEPLSDMCKRYFVRDLCFYECSPNVGPWLVQESRTWRKERMYHAPLCETDCNTWYNECKNEKTCLDNWSNGGFNFSSGVNTCPTGKPCKPFHEIFGNATNFCETIWDGSWKVTPDDKPCMKMWFDATKENPNDAVAKQRAMEILQISGVTNLASSFVFIIFAVLIATLV
ncbi:folate receptor gamma [Lingula anatina]|uniref:Folate receptor gamma n=1 Tax=Lingula anatina TaxID=7574 RepID=A0A1S3KCF9_LINAN|nr:folate receptor gamma [Lingula anatina]XP_013420319.1 folate receptor gamma [Lingula anatina]|eukprot:XP_013420318.1 folate receptor gamma [Lingula anatina]